MRNVIFLLGTLLAACTMTSAAQSAVTVIGASQAQACFTAAVRPTATLQGIRICNEALDDTSIVARNRVATYVNRGIIYFRRGQYDQALEDFDAAIALNPNQPEALLNKAITLLRRDENGTDALPYFSRALELGTEQPALAHYGRGLAYNLLGNYGSAYNDILRAAELDPDWEEPRRDLQLFIVEPNS